MLPVGTLSILKILETRTLVSGSISSASEWRRAVIPT